MINSNFLPIAALLFFSTSLMQAADISKDVLQEQLSEANQFIVQADAEGLSLENLMNEMSAKMSGLGQTQNPIDTFRAYLDVFVTSFMATSVASLHISRELAKSKLEVAQLKDALIAAGAAPVPLSDSHALIVHPTLKPKQPAKPRQALRITFNSPAILMPPLSEKTSFTQTPQKRTRWCARLCGARFAHDTED